MNFNFGGLSVNIDIPKFNIKEHITTENVWYATTGIVALTLIGMTPPGWVALSTAARVGGAAVMMLGGLFYQCISSGKVVDKAVESMVQPIKDGASTAKAAAQTASAVADVVKQVMAPQKKSEEESIWEELAKDACSVPVKKAPLVAQNPQVDEEPDGLSNAWDTVSDLGKQARELVGDDALKAAKRSSTMRQLKLAFTSLSLAVLGTGAVIAASLPEDANAANAMAFFDEQSREDNDLDLF